MTGLKQNSMPDEFPVADLDSIDFVSTDFDEAEVDKVSQQLEEEHNKTIEQQMLNSTTQESDDAYTYWFLIVMLILFVFFIGLGAIMLIRGRRKKYVYQSIGYQR